MWFNKNSTCLGQTRELNGTSLLEYIDKVNITNTSIMFDDSGGVLGSYEIFNYQATFSSTGDITGYKYVAVGTWLSGKLTIVNDTDMQFGLKSDDSLRREPIKSQCGGCRPGMYVRDIPGSCCALCEPCLGANFSSNPKAITVSLWGRCGETIHFQALSQFPRPQPCTVTPWAIPSLIITYIGVLCVAATAVI